NDGLSPTNKLEIELDGEFFVVPLVNSSLSVQVTCNGGTTYFYPAILSQNFIGQTQQEAVVVSLANPGNGNAEQCTFVVEDTFTDASNNIVTVSSPGITAEIDGI